MCVIEVCVCVGGGGGLVRTYIRGQICVLIHQQGTPTSGDVPGPYNHANSTSHQFWTCLI